MKKELVLVLDFGGQYNQLIARRVRECNVYCEIVPYTMSLDEILAKSQRELYLQAALTVYMMKHHLHMTRLYLTQEYQFWEFATAVSSWRTSLVVLLQQHL